MTRPPQKRGFGVAAGLPAEVCGPLAEACEQAGYDALFSNDHPGAKGLETLAEFAKSTDRLDLGVGVIALDRHSPEEIMADIDRLGLDPSRLWIGLGAGMLGTALLGLLLERTLFRRLYERDHLAHRGRIVHSKD